MAQKEQEQEKLPKDLLPKDLDIDEQNNKVTIKLGDGVDLNEIIEYLRNKHIVSQISNEPNKDGYHHYIINNYDITFTINGKNNVSDQYSYTIKKGLVFRFNKKNIQLSVGNNGVSLLSNSLHFKEFNNSQATKNDKIEPYVAGRTSLSICKDSKGNLSWYQVNKDGKIYMRNHLENNNPITNNNNDYPDLAPTNQWKPIKNTYGSNINAWWHTKIDDYDKIEEEDRPLSMKRLGRVLIGQDNMTGECLWGHGCLRCCGSGYNEEPFYNTENLSDKLNILNEQ